MLVSVAHIRVLQSREDHVSVAPAMTVRIICATSRGGLRAMMRHWFGLLFSVFYFCAPALADQSYDRRLVEHLNRFKQYPASANARHASGETLVTFSVDREGRIVSSSVVRSSGDDELDRASLEMLLRAQPLPSC